MRPKLPTVSDCTPYLLRIDEARVYANTGPLVRELEARHADRLGVAAERVVCLANATLGIAASVACLPATHWIVPAYTFAATAHAVVIAGGTILWSDVDPCTWQLAVIDQDVALSSNPYEEAGRVLVAPFGSWPSLALLDSKPLVIDAAASLGNSDIDLHRLPTDATVVFSLHATKVLSSGEGALVVAGNLDLAARIRSWANFGFDSDRISTHGGCNAKMSEVSAAYGLASLDTLSLESSEWTAVRECAVEAIAFFGCEQIQFSLAQPGFNSYWTCEMSNAGAARRLTEALASQGIEARRWWPAALPSMPAFSQRGLDGDFSSAKALSQRVVGLPFHRDLSSDVVQIVARTLADHNS